MGAGRRFDMRALLQTLRALAFVLAGSAASAAPWSHPAETPQHPLDPLTPVEIQATLQILKTSGKLGSTSRFPLVVLQEAAKTEILAFRAGTALRRRAFAVVLDRPRNRTFEALVDLQARAVESWKEIPGVQPNLLAEEFTSAPDLVRADARWQDAMRRRGITHFDQVLVDAWAPGVIGDPGPPGARLVRAITFYRGEAHNSYGRPVEGVVAVVDMNRRAVLQVSDTGVVPLAPNIQDFDVRSVGPLREAPRPLHPVQPRGPSFEIHGHEVAWQNWRFRFALHPREGLVLYLVSYMDHGRARPVLYRASLSEMVVPYGDPAGDWAWRNAFDEGEYGLGRLANALEPEKDAPENATFLDAVLADDGGAPYTTPRALYVYERDGGLLWKHFDDQSRRSETRRARQLVIGFVATVGNYDYAFSWIFGQDGALKLEVALSGIVLGKGVQASRCGVCPKLTGGETPNGDDRYGCLVADRVVAPNHQHFFNFRLDFDVEGAANSVAEMNVHAVPQGASNPHGNAFVMEETVLGDELKARRDVSLEQHRRWKVFNPSVRNDLGHLVAYMLVPGDNSVPYLDAKNSTRQRAGFVDHHVWVTCYKPEEQYAAGSYPNQSRGGDGLPRWTAGAEPLVNRDVVIWYTFGVTHSPRPEDWPVMPVVRAGFDLVPAGFFSRNPALDVPDMSSR